MESKKRVTRKPKTPTPPIINDSPKSSDSGIIPIITPQKKVGRPKLPPKIKIKKEKKPPLSEEELKERKKLWNANSRARSKKVRLINKLAKYNSDEIDFIFSAAKQLLVNCDETEAVSSSSDSADK